MKKFITYMLLILFMALTNKVEAIQEELPSEKYYRENIMSQSADISPSLKAGDDDLDPGGSGLGEGGHVGSPIGDAILPVLTATGLYFCLMIRRRKRTKT